jgi:hypothetical protein
MAQLERGLDLLRKFCINNKQNKKVQIYYPNLLNEINKIGQESKERVCKRHMQTTRFLHSLNLLRFFGEHKNGGVYNMECLIFTHRILSSIFKENEELQIYIDDWYPMPKFLAGIQDQWKKRQELRPNNSTDAFTSDFEKLVECKPFDFVLQKPFTFTTRFVETVGHISGRMRVPIVDKDSALYGKVTSAQEITNMFESVGI